MRGEPERLRDLERRGPEHGCYDVFYLNFAADVIRGRAMRLPALICTKSLPLWNKTLLEQLAGGLR